MKARQTIRQRESLASYERRVSRRDAERERALMGETLAAFHARENAKPPTPPAMTQARIAGYFVHESALKRLVMDARFAGRITAGECAWLIQFYGLKHA